MAYGYEQIREETCTILLRQLKTQPGQMLQLKYQFSCLPRWMAMSENHLAFFLFMWTGRCLLACKRTGFLAERQGNFCFLPEQQLELANKQKRTDTQRAMIGLFDRLGSDRIGFQRSLISMMLWPIVQQTNRTIKSAQLIETKMNKHGTNRTPKGVSSLLLTHLNSRGYLWIQFDIEFSPILDFLDIDRLSKGLG